MVERYVALFSGNVIINLSDLSYGISMLSNYVSDSGVSYYF